MGKKILGILKSILYTNITKVFIVLSLLFLIYIIFLFFIPHLLPLTKTLELKLEDEVILTAKHPILSGTISYGNKDISIGSPCYDDVRVIEFRVEDKRPGYIHYATSINDYLNTYLDPEANYSIQKIDNTEFYVYDRQISRTFHRRYLVTFIEGIMVEIKYVSDRTPPCGWKPLLAEKIIKSIKFSGKYSGVVVPRE